MSPSAARCATIPCRFTAAASQCMKPGRTGPQRFSARGVAACAGAARSSASAQARPRVPGRRRAKAIATYVLSALRREPLGLDLRGMAEGVLHRGRAIVETEPLEVPARLQICEVVRLAARGLLGERQRRYTRQ